MQKALLHLWNSAFCNSVSSASDYLVHVLQGFAHGVAQGFAQLEQPANAGAANITATATTNTNNANFFIVIPSFSVMTTIRALKVYMKIWLLASQHDIF